jgi:hypothetical protein
MARAVTAVRVAGDTEPALLGVSFGLADRGDSRASYLSLGVDGRSAAVGSENDRRMEAGDNGWPVVSRSCSLELYDVGVEESAVDSRWSGLGLATLRRLASESTGDEAMPTRRADGAVTAVFAALVERADGGVTTLALGPFASLWARIPSASVKGDCEAL